MNLDTRFVVGVSLGLGLIAFSWHGGDVPEDRVYAVGPNAWASNAREYSAETSRGRRIDSGEARAAPTLYAVRTDEGHEEQHSRYRPVPAAPNRLPALDCLRLHNGQWLRGGIKHDGDSMRWSQCWYDTVQREEQ